MEPREIIGQIVGIIAMLTMCISYQFKKSPQIFLTQLIASFLFSVHFLLIGAYTGLILNAVELLRGYLLYREDKKWTGSYPVIIIITALMGLGGILTWEGWYSLFPTLAMVAGTPLLWTRKEKVIRFTGLFLISPFWLIYNIRVLSIAGIINESLNIGSIIISLIRYRGKKKPASALKAPPSKQ